MPPSKHVSRPRTHPLFGLADAAVQMMYGRLYLNIGLFKELARSFKRNVVLILAEKDGKVSFT